MSRKEIKSIPMSRPPLERMMRIHGEIQAGQYPNASTLARTMEVSTKTIHRDLDFMRDRMDLPLEYDGSKFGFFYYEEVSAFPTMQISEGELVALLIAE
ncbi:MAG: proteasome accessory factor B, partial [Limisphaerales bacterium]